MDLALAMHRCWLDLLKSLEPERLPSPSIPERYALSAATASLLNIAIAPNSAQPLSTPDMSAAADIFDALNSILADYEAGRAQTPEERSIGKALAHIKREYLG